MFPGRIIADRYRVLRVLGRGGMGVVSEVEEIESGKRFAIKFLREDVESDMQPSARFLREAKLATRLKSPHTCRVSEIGEWQLGPYLVMELLHGRTLSAIIENEVTITWQQAVRIAFEMCNALAEAHRLGIVHRDVKPGNVCLASASDGTVITKVLDFGVAKIPETVVTAYGDRSLTDATTLLGTPSYVAPEQLMNSKLVDSRADIWAVGVLLYEMLAGRLPFSSPLVPKLLVMIAREDPAPLSTLAPTAPDELVRIVDRCLKKDRSQRYADASILAQALSPWLDSTPDLLKPLLLLQPKPTSIDPTEPPPCDATQAEPSNRRELDSLDPHTAADSNRHRCQRRSRLRCIATGSCLGALASLLYLVAGTMSEPHHAMARRETHGAASASLASTRPLHHLVVLVDPAQAQVQLDDAAVSGNPARLTSSDDGKLHRLTISSPGYVTESRSVRFDVDQQLSLSLSPQSTPSTPSTPSGQPDRKPSRQGATRAPKTESTKSVESQSKASFVRRIDMDNPF